MPTFHFHRGSPIVPDARAGPSHTRCVCNMKPTRNGSTSISPFYVQDMQTSASAAAVVAVATATTTLP